MAREVRDGKEEQRKETVDRARRPDPAYQPGDFVLVTVHAVSKAAQGVSAKFAPRRDGPYVIKTRQGAATYVLAKPDDPEQPIGTFHTSALTPYRGDINCLPAPIQPIRKRGRPRNPETTQPTRSTRGRGRPKKKH